MIGALALAATWVIPTLSKQNVARVAAQVVMRRRAQVLMKFAEDRSDSVPDELAGAGLVHSIEKVETCWGDRHVYMPSQSLFEIATARRWPIAKDHGTTIIAVPIGSFEYVGSEARLYQPDYARVLVWFHFRPNANLATLEFFAPDSAWNVEPDLFHDHKMSVDDFKHQNSAFLTFRRHRGEWSVSDDEFTAYVLGGPGSCPPE